MITAPARPRPSTLVSAITALLSMGHGAAAAGPCEQGGCADVAADPCWEISSQQCTATPGSASFTQGPAVFLGVGDAVDCDACRLAEGEGVINIAIGQETGFKFCITLEAGVEFSAGASLCGFALEGAGSAGVATQSCVDTKHWVDHDVRCRCPAGSLVHCRTIREMVPIRVTVPIDYDLTTCFIRRHSTGTELCEPPANGMMSFTQTIHCGAEERLASDTRLKVTAAFITGECTPPVDADEPVESKPKG